MKNTLLVAGALTACTVQAVEKKSPNIILINLDDVGYGDFSYNGAYGYSTPHIDNMAAEGMRFTHFLAGQAISGASRAGCLSVNCSN